MKSLRDWSFRFSIPLFRSCQIIQLPTRKRNKFILGWLDEPVIERVEARGWMARLGWINWKILCFVLGFRHSSIDGNFKVDVMFVRCRWPKCSSLSDFPDDTEFDAQISAPFSSGASEWHPQIAVLDVSNICIQGNRIYCCDCISEWEGNLSLWRRQRTTRPS